MVSKKYWRAIYSFIYTFNVVGDHCDLPQPWTLYSLYSLLENCLFSWADILGFRFESKLYSFLFKRELEKIHRFEWTNLPWETKDTFLNSDQTNRKSRWISRIRRNVDNIFAKDSSATLLKRIRRQTDIVTNGMSYMSSVNLFLKEHFCIS